MRPLLWAPLEEEGLLLAGEGDRWKGTALLLFSRRWGRMEERPGDGNERVRGFCSVKEKGRVKGR
jgi:hypothetical protein